MQMQQRQPRDSGQRRRWRTAGVSAAVLAVLGTVALFVLNAVLGGILGNGATALFAQLLTWFGQAGLGLVFWIVVSVVVAVVVVLLFLVLWITHLHREVEELERENGDLKQQSEDLEHHNGELNQQNRVLERAFTTQHNIVLLDDSLLRLLASWIPLRDHENEMKRILAELLSDATTEFNGHVHRASILLPDGDYLKVWSHQGMPAESVRDIRFYIGTDRTILRGVAGEAFVDQHLYVGHMNVTSNGCICDDANYTNGRRRTFPPYLSFVTIPIIGVSPTITTGNATICLGVVCFDSLQLDIFDSNEIHEVLRIFARRIAAALLIFHQLP